jgi:hypothetical protein
MIVVTSLCISCAGVIASGLEEPRSKSKDPRTVFSYNARATCVQQRTTRSCVDVPVLLSAQASHDALYITLRGKRSHYELPSPSPSRSPVSASDTPLKQQKPEITSPCRAFAESCRGTRSYIHQFVRVNQGHQLARAITLFLPTLLDRPEITEARVTPGPQPELTRPPPPTAPARRARRQCARGSISLDPVSDRLRETRLYSLENKDQTLRTGRAHLAWNTGRGTTEV